MSNQASLLIYAVLAIHCWLPLALEYDDEVGNSGANKTVVVLQSGISTSAQASIWSLGLLTIR